MLKKTRRIILIAAVVLMMCAMTTVIFAASDTGKGWFTIGEGENKKTGMYLAKLEVDSYSVTASNEVTKYQGPIVLGYRATQQGYAFRANGAQLASLDAEGEFSSSITITVSNSGTSNKVAKACCIFFFDTAQLWDSLDVYPG